MASRERNVALGLVPSQGHAPSRRVAAACPSHSGHPIRHSGDRRHAPYPDTGPESRRGGAKPSHTSRTNVSIGSSLVGAQNDSQTRAIRGLRRPELCNYPHRTSPARQVLFIYELSMMGEVSSVS